MSLIGMLFGLAAKEYSKRIIVENLLPVLILESW
jgi:hypothetical protein